MQIGIIGSGNVGGTLGKKWAAGGHQVVFGSRNPESNEMKALVAEAGSGASAASQSEAAKCEVVLLATPWPATKQVLTSLGDLSGRVLIDATNPVLPDLSGLEIGNTTSAGELVASWAAGAKVVKAFNTIGAGVMATPIIEGQPATMFYCGDDSKAKSVVHELASGIGFDARDAGALRQARVLEPFALLWISLALGQGYGFGFAFKVIGHTPAK